MSPDPWQPTTKLRWVKQPDPEAPTVFAIDPRIPTVYILVLQQFFRNADSGMTEWRDVQIEEDDG